MRISHVMALVAAFWALVGATMLAPAGVALLYGERVWRAFGLTSAACMVSGACLFLLLRDRQSRGINHREGAAVVTFAWIAAAFLGAVPFFFSGDFATFTDAVFEAASGFTTTGASVLADVEACGKGVLFWRALTQWLGGMGFIVVSIALLPYLGVGGLELYKAEVPSPTPDRLAPRFRDTARVMWKIYAALTAILAALLAAGGMGPFDAVCHAFSAISTGGFSTKNGDIGAYASAYIEWVIAIFVLLGSMSFMLHYQALRGRLRAVWRNDEWRFFMALVLGSTIIVTAVLFASVGKGFSDALRLGFFQVANIASAAGFASEDYSVWHTGALAGLLLLFCMGGCAGSTTGGPKCLRILLSVRHSGRELMRIVHPRLVAPVKLGGRTVPPRVISSVWAFLGLYVTVFFSVGVALSMMGVDLGTAFTASIACLGNIGPGLGDVGPAGHYGALPAAGKWLLTATMIVGRLELYAILVLLLPEFWRK